MNPAKDAHKPIKKKRSKKSIDNQVLIAEDDRIREEIAQLSSEGYHYVAAPPGCGKTDLLTKRVIQKARSEGFDADVAKKMLCVTFTRNAAEEMQNRVEKEIKKHTDEVIHCIRDIHSYAVMKLAELLKEEGSSRVILLPEKKYAILDSILSKNNITTLKKADTATKDGKEYRRRKKSKQTFAFTKEQKEFICRFSNLCLLLDGINIGDDSFDKLVEDPREYSGKGTPYSTLHTRLKALERSIKRHIKSWAAEHGKEPGIWDYILSEYRKVMVNLEYTRQCLLKVKENNRKSVAIITSFIPFIANKLREDKWLNRCMDYEDALIHLYLKLRERDFEKQQKNGKEDKDVVDDKFNWVEVDECQDTSLLQLLLIDEATDKENACVVYFGDEEQNIYSSITDTSLAMRFIHAKVSKRAERYLRGNFRSQKALLEFILQYQKNFFPKGSGKDNRSPICRYEPAGHESTEEAVKVIISGNNLDQYEDILKEVTESKAQGQTAILFRRNEDVKTFYNFSKSHIDGIGDIRDDDICIIGKENSLFHMDVFRPIKAILHAASGLFYEKWWYDLPLPEKDGEKAGKAICADDEQLLKQRISPQAVLDKDHRYTYLVEYSLALRRKWETDLRDHQNHQEALTPVILYYFDYFKKQLTLEKFNVKLRGKPGGKNKRDLLKVRIGFVSSGEPLVVPFKDFPSMVSSIREFLGEGICMTAHAPQHMSQMRKYPEVYNLLFSQPVWDIKRLYDELFRNNRAEYNEVVAADVYNAVMCFDPDKNKDEQKLKGSVPRGNLHTSHMAMVKNNRDYITYRSAIEAQYGQTYHKVVSLLSQTDNVDVEEDALDLQNESAGYLIVRAVKMIWNSLPSARDEKYASHIKGLIKYLHNTVKEQNEKHSILQDDLYSQIFRLRRALFTCTVSKLISTGNIESSIVAMTVHKSKGLTFENVIIADAVMGLYPLIRTKSKGKAFIEHPELIPQEDVNLFYVAITRAKHSIRFYWYPVKITKNHHRVKCRRTPLLSFYEEADTQEKA